jgi:hypothetical protein
MRNVRERKRSRGEMIYLILYDLCEPTEKNEIVGQ